MFTRPKGVVKKKVNITAMPLPALPTDDDAMPPPPPSVANVTDQVDKHRKAIREFIENVNAKIDQKIKMLEACDKEIAGYFAKMNEAKAARSQYAMEINALAKAKETKLMNEMNGLYKVLIEKLK